MSGLIAPGSPEPAPRKTTPHTSTPRKTSLDTFVWVMVVAAVVGLTGMIYISVSLYSVQASGYVLPPVFIPVAIVTFIVECCAFWPSVFSFRRYAGWPVLALALVAIFTFVNPITVGLVAAYSSLQAYGNGMH